MFVYTENGRSLNVRSAPVVGDNQIGEFITRGYHVMKGYYKMPKETAQAIDENGWLHTGDLALRTPEGNYRITGRLKDMIIRGGENIYPKEIEEFIYSNPKVQDVQVIGIPDKALGEEILAAQIRRVEVAGGEGVLAFREFLYRHADRREQVDEVIDIKDVRQVVDDYRLLGEQHGAEHLKCFVLRALRGDGTMQFMSSFDYKCSHIRCS